MPDIYVAPRRSQWPQSRLRALARIGRPDRSELAIGPVKGLTRRAGDDKLREIQGCSATNANAPGFFLWRQSPAAAVPHLHLRKAQWPLYRISNQYPSRR